jgi:RNA polymerase sigma factor (sigma-70 family)
MQSIQREAENMTEKTDEELILDYRNEAATDALRDKIFSTMLSRRRVEKPCWETIIRKFVRWRLSKAKRIFDIYDEDDLVQRCLCCFYKAVSQKFDFSFNVKFSTYMYTALNKTVNRVLVELRKKKRTVEINGKRLSPQYFTDSLQKPITGNGGDDSNSMTLSEVIAEQDDDISENESIIADSILLKCQKYLTPMQYEIFIHGDIHGITSGKELAKKYNKSEPTISAIKKRKIVRALKRIRSEITEEFNLSTL